MITKLGVAAALGMVLVGGLSANANAFEGRGFRGREVVMHRDRACERPIYRRVLPRRGWHRF